MHTLTLGPHVPNHTDGYRMPGRDQLHNIPLHIMVCLKRIIRCTSKDHPMLQSSRIHAGNNQGIRIIGTLQSSPKLLGTVSENQPIFWLLPLHKRMNLLLVFNSNCLVFRDVKVGGFEKLTKESACGPNQSEDNILLTKN